MFSFPRGPVDIRESLFSFSRGPVDIREGLFSFSRDPVDIRDNRFGRAPFLIDIFPGRDAPGKYIRLFIYLSARSLHREHSSESSRGDVAGQINDLGLHPRRVRQCRAISVRSP